MTFNDLKRFIVTFRPNKTAKPSTDSESWGNFTQIPSFGFFNLSLLNLKGQKKIILGSNFDIFDSKFIDSVIPLNSKMVNWKLQMKVFV